jgi:hypothetical protein
VSSDEEDVLIVAALLAESNQNLVFIYILLLLKCLPCIITISLQYVMQILVLVGEEKEKEVTH